MIRDTTLLLVPNYDNIREYLHKFDVENELYERAINKIVNIFPLNINYDDILIKVILINKIYNTNIYNVYLMSESIMNLNIDDDIKNNNIDVIAKIDKSYYKIKDGKRKYISCYSFATKYCNFHNKSYPIYDSIIADMLYLYKLKDNFAQFNKIELRDYNIFIDVLNKFILFYNINDINYKDLDKFLWQYGKKFLYNDYK